MVKVKATGVKSRDMMDKVLVTEVEVKVRLTKVGITQLGSRFGF